MLLHPILGPPRGNLSTISLESLKPIQPIIVIYLSVPERVSFCVVSLINNHSRSYPPTHSSNSALYIKHFLTRFIYPLHTIYSPGHQTAKCANIRNEAKGKKKGISKGYYQHRLPIPSHPIPNQPSPIPSAVHARPRRLCPGAKAKYYNRRRSSPS